MNLTKITYTQGKTAISAKNLNDIQDNIIANKKEINNITKNILTLKDSLEALSLQLSNFQNQNNAFENRLTSQEEKISQSEKQSNYFLTKDKEYEEKFSDIKDSLALCSTVTISTTEPSNPKEGDIWINPEDDGILIISDKLENNKHSLITGEGISNALNELFSLTQIWENASNNSFFPNQTIVCKDLNYDLFLILFKKNTSDDTYISSFGLNSFNTYIEVEGNYRIWKGTSEGIEFNNCSYENYLIPYKIYGIKKGV